VTELKTFSQLARMIESEQRADAERTRQERSERKCERQDKAVAGGLYCPDPVDRAAAMMLARAPWWAFAPSVKRKPKQEERTVPERHTYAERTKDCDQKLMTVVDGKEMVDMDELAARICAKIENNVPKELRALAECAVNARGMLDASISGIGRSMDEFERVTKAAGQQVRSQRMSIVSECSSVVNALKDVRQFFLGPDYEREQKRLAEFVDLCERMQRLKDSGFLDTVADTMIRLAASEK
jgi:hypothetical protein